MKRILVVYWHPPGVEMRATVAQHLHALDTTYEGISYHNGFFDFPRQTKRRSYDAIILHNTFLCMRWSDEFTRYALSCEWIAERSCTKIALPQDEYDHHEVLDEWLTALGVTHVFSNFGADLRPTLYPLLESRATFTEVLTGYIDDTTVAPSPTLADISSRPLDVVYRSSNLPFWFGSQGQLKVRLGDVIGREAASLGLRADISSKPEDTLYGSSWSTFLASSRTTIGCETGSSVLDHRGEVQSAIRTIQREAPAASFEEVSAQMPNGWDAHTFFAIGPRHLEAIATGTTQILVEGAYSGVLEAERHYIPVNRDLSNVRAALTIAQDPEQLAPIAARAFNDIFLSGRYTYAALAKLLGDVIGGAESASHPPGPPIKASVGRRSASSAAISGIVRHPISAVRIAQLVTRGAPGKSGRNLLWHLARDIVTRRVKTHEVMSDLIRLGVLAEWTRGRAVNVVQQSVRELVVSQDSADRVGSDGVFWRHQDLRSPVALGRNAGSVALGQDGVYRFRSLSVLAAQRPQVVYRALRAVSESGR